MKSPGKIYIVFLLFFLLSSLKIYGDVKLPKLISDGMVLQRNANVKIWGWASENEKINISFLNQTYSVSADENGDWSLELSDLVAGGPYTMEIKGNNEIIIKDILIGDVWVCSGQSQMDITMERVSPIYQEEIKKAGNNYIRYFSVPTAYDFNSPQEDYKSGNWQPITQENILSISAIAYFFADELYNKYKIPIGIIRSSLGGSPAEAWISEDALKEFPVHYEELLKHKNPSFIDSISAADRERINEWYSRLNMTDEGYKNQPWYLPGINTSDWMEMDIPGFWADDELGFFNGVVWFRKSVNIPASFSGKPAKLLLGTIVDADSVFVNGVYVGSTGYQYPPRRYKIPADLLKAGKNTIVIRVISNSGKGGFVLDKPYEIVFEDQKINLKGRWLYQLGAKMEPLKPETFIRWKPAGLFNGMIAPLTDFSIKGVLWYQGESNTDRTEEYKKLLPALIKNWREKWNIGDFPFLFVQLHGFLESFDYPSEGSWASMREAQTAALALPNTEMAVAIDLGEWNDVHPLNKKDVAKRLALAAYKTAYNEDVVYSGPRYNSHIISGDSIIIKFDNIGSGLIVKGGGELKHFAIAGKDKKFIWGKAKVDGDKVIVWSDEIKDPVAVRYAWANNPESANLYNKEGLPAAPFRTDNWERLTN